MHTPFSGRAGGEEGGGGGLSSPGSCAASLGGDISERLSGCMHAYACNTAVSPASDPPWEAAFSSFLRHVRGARAFFPCIQLDNGRDFEKLILLLCAVLCVPMSPASPCPASFSPVTSSFSPLCLYLH